MKYKFCAIKNFVEFFNAATDIDNQLKHSLDVGGATMGRYLPPIGPKLDGLMSSLRKYGRF